jgi:tetratricopeptide (TPR) repeat protein
MFVLGFLFTLSFAFAPMNEIYHPVSTTNEEAQKSFNEGLTAIFAFNHDIAYREFEKAARHDPKLAMAYWGMALSLGQNVNADVTPENELRCYALTQKALELAPEASLSDQAYIKASATRYTNDLNGDFIPLRFHYREAMKKVMEAYPEDLDAAALYAESILNLDPWKWWSLDGKPLEGTMEAIQVLESALKRNPEHIGLNHYYIHAYEESPTPERALMSAHRLMTLLPQSGHLLHMPCHIFDLVGDYELCIKTNKRAIAADRAYIKEFGISGHYPVHYLSHNLSVLSRVYMLMEDYPRAISTASELVQFVGPHVQHEPKLFHFLKVPLEIYLYFHKWNEILLFPKPCLDSPPLQAYWHMSRAIAYAALCDFDCAEQERTLLLQAKKNIKEEEISNNPAAKVIAVGELILNATIAHAQNNLPTEIDFLKQAVAAQDLLFYDEPPAWFAPIRLTLGAALIQQKKYPEAETAFREALQKLQRNGRILFGLAIALEKQKKAVDAFWVEREAKAALTSAYRPLTLDDL